MGQEGQDNNNALTSGGNLLVHPLCHAYHELPLSMVTHLLVAFDQPLPRHLCRVWWIWEIGKMNIFGPENALMNNYMLSFLYCACDDVQWMQWCSTWVQEDTENEKWISSFLHDCICIVVVHTPNLFTLDVPQQPCHLSALDEWSHKQMHSQKQVFFTTTTFQPHQTGVGRLLTPTWVTIST